MKKLIGFVLALLCIPTLAFAAFEWNGAAVTVWNGASVAAWNGTVVGADVTAPEVSTVTIGTDGETVTIAFTETVVTTGYDDGDFNLDCTTAGDGIALNTIDGSGSSRTFTAASTINSGDTCNCDYTGSADEIEDAAGNDLAGTLTNIAVTNSSEQGGAVPTFKYAAENAADGSATSIATSTTINIAAGDFVVIGVAGTNDYPVSSVTCGVDSATQAGSEAAASGYGVSVWYIANASANASATCTANWGTSDNSLYRRIGAATYSGVATSSVLDKNSCNEAACNATTSTATSRTAQNVTTTVDSELLVLWSVDWEDHTEHTGTNSYTQRLAVGTKTYSLADKTVSSTGSYPNGAVITVNDHPSDDSYLSVFATFKGL